MTKKLKVVIEFLIEGPDVAVDTFAHATEAAIDGDHIVDAIMGIVEELPGDHAADIEILNALTWDDSPDEDDLAALADVPRLADLK